MIFLKNHTCVISSDAVYYSNSGADHCDQSRLDMLRCLRIGERVMEVQSSKANSCHSQRLIDEMEEGERIHPYMYVSHVAYLWESKVLM